jgi:hypothetical protein
MFTIRVATTVYYRRDHELHAEEYINEISDDGVIPVGDTQMFDQGVMKAGDFGIVYRTVRRIKPSEGLSDHGRNSIGIAHVCLKWQHAPT